MPSIAVHVPLATILASKPIVRTWPVPACRRPPKVNPESPRPLLRSRRSSQYFYVGRGLIFYCAKAESRIKGSSGFLIRREPNHTKRSGRFFEKRTD